MAIMIDGHALDIELDGRRDREHLSLDGQQVSARRTFSGTTHVFTASGALWEVDTHALPWPGTEITEVRLDGETVYPG